MLQSRSEQSKSEVRDMGSQGHRTEGKDRADNSNQNTLLE